jgi:hypothetical protein
VPIGERILLAILFPSAILAASWWMAPASASFRVMWYSRRPIEPPRSLRGMDESQTRLTLTEWTRTSGVVLAVVAFVVILVAR